jgi:beta-lactamase class A
MNCRLAIAMALVVLPLYLPAAPSRLDALPAAIAQLERLNGGRIGVAVLDSATGQRFGFRADERFPMCSTFKFLLVSAVLQRVDRHREMLNRAVSIPQKPLLYNSPLTEAHAGGSMTIGALCHAALIQSDNTAANLLLESIGGPAGITGFSRRIGDQVTRLDRFELALNESLAGDPRDTTSPSSMAGDLRAVLLGSLLSSASRGQLTSWMEASLTGLDRLRARLPEGWRTADKTGSNGHDTTNDIAVIWPAGGPAIVVAVYITQCAGPESKRSALIAQVGRLVSESIP